MVPPVSRIDAPPEGWILDVLGGVLRPRGLNLLGTASVGAYDAGVPAAYALRRLMPEAETAIVVGNGGAALWNAYRDFIGRHPAHAALADPLDAYTEQAVAEAVAALAGRVPLRILHPFRFP